MTPLLTRRRFAAAALALATGPARAIDDPIALPPAAPDEKVRRFFESAGCGPQDHYTIGRALYWLKQQQRSDGLWAFDDGARKADTAAATGLALLPFLAAGETHKFAKKYRTNVAAGLKALRAAQQADGGFGCLSTAGTAWALLALSEAYAVTGDAALRGPARKAADFLAAAQQPDGGWAANPGFGSDTVSTAWAVQALASADRSLADTNGRGVNARAFGRAGGYLDAVATGPGKTLFRPSPRWPAGVATAATSGGVAARMLAGGVWADDPWFVAATDNLADCAPTAERFNPEFAYFAAVAVRRRGGEAWARRWKPAVTDVAAALQVRADGPAHGSVAPPGKAGDRLTATALSALTVEVHYGHLSPFKQP